MGSLNTHIRLTKIGFSTISVSIKYTNYTMENALHEFYSLVELYQKSHSFAALTYLFPDTTRE